MSAQIPAVNPAPACMPEDLREAVSETPTPLFSDNLERMSGMLGLTRINRGRRLVGTAFTVRTRPGDNLGLYKALDMLQPGHVLVVDGGGECSNALAGELIMLYARSRGCAGFVLDAAIRDRRCFEDEDFPCFARGVNHRGPFKSGPASLNVPVSIGGQVVSPGDVVVGDEDGLVSFAQSDAKRLVAAARETARAEEQVRDAILSGNGRELWLSKLLERYGL